MECDPGPLARFEAVKLDGQTPEAIVQRLIDGESLREIAREWRVPYKRFLAWIAANGELSDRCRRVRELAGTELRMEGLEILDEATNDDIAVRKEQANYRKDLSRDLNKPLFGLKQDNAAFGAMTVVVDRSCGGAIQVKAAVMVGDVSPQRAIEGTQALPVETAEDI